MVRCYRSIKLVKLAVGGGGGGGRGGGEPIAKASYGTCEYATHRSVQLCLIEQESHWARIFLFSGSREISGQT